MAYDAAANIIKQAAVELGLGSLADDVYGNTDSNVVQLCGLLSSVGVGLCKVRPWTHLQKEYTFTTDGSPSYPLPQDFRAPLPRSMWNRTTAFPLGSPLSPQEWQALSAYATTLTVTLFARQKQGRLFVYPQTDSGSLVAYEYLSTYWVQPDGQTSPTARAPTANSDTLWFDGLLLMQGLKVAWLQAKGFDATAAANDYAQTLALAQGEDAPPTTLSLSGNSSGVRMLDGSNIPETGYGP